MKLYAVILMITMTLFVLPGQKNIAANQDGSKTKYPQVLIRDTELRHLKSDIVGENYEIDISLPRNYHKKNQRYPVIYVLDAEYNFGCVSYITRRLIKNRDIPKSIVVGIAYNTSYEQFYDKRVRDCTPPSSFRGHQTGGIEKFIQFFRKELIPFVNKNYRTIPEDRTITGHSLGGFFCCYALLKHPDIFNRYIIASPSLWYSNRIMFTYEEEYAKNHQDLKAIVYMATGANESELMVSATTDFIARLKKRNYKNLRWRPVLPKGEHHRSIFPFAYTKGLTFIFKKDH